VSASITTLIWARQNNKRAINETLDASYALDASDMMRLGASSEEGNPRYQSFLGKAKKKA